jgi:hypothetical protein
VQAFPSSLHSSIHHLDRRVSPAASSVSQTRASKLSGELLQHQ